MYLLKSQTQGEELDLVSKAEVKIPELYSPLFHEHKKSAFQVCTENIYLEGNELC